MSGISRNNLFCFFQIRGYRNKKKCTLLNNAKVSNIKRQIFRTGGDISITVLYTILKGYTKPGVSKLGQTWKRELGVEITDDIWEDIWNNARITICNRSRALQLKILHWTHLSPSHFSKFKAGASCLWPECKINTGSLTHCLWSSLRLQKYWESVLCEMQKILKDEIDFDSVFLLYGLPNKRIQNKHLRKQFNVQTFCARKKRLLQLITHKPPNYFWVAQDNNGTHCTRLYELLDPL